MAKLKILNKKRYDKSNIHKPQCFVKGELKAAGEIIELDFKNNEKRDKEKEIAEDLVYGGRAAPADPETEKEFLWFKLPSYTDAPEGK